MAGNTNPNDIVSPSNLVADFSALSTRAQQVITALAGITPPYTLTNVNAAQVPFTIKGASGQTANVLDFKDNADAVKLSVSSNHSLIWNNNFAAYLGLDIASNRFEIGTPNNTRFYVSSVPIVDINSSGLYLFNGHITEDAQTPAQITANQNNYSLTNLGVQRLSSDAARNITGIVAASNGSRRMLINVGSFNITLQHENAGSTAANRFLCSTGADIVLSPNQAADIWYDISSSRWRVFKRN